MSLSSRSVAGRVERIAEADVCIPTSWKPIEQPHAKCYSQKRQGIHYAHMNTASTDSLASMSGADSQTHLPAFTESALTHLLSIKQLIALRRTG